MFTNVCSQWSEKKTTITPRALISSHRGLFPLRHCTFCVFRKSYVLLPDVRVYKPDRHLCCCFAHQQRCSVVFDCVIWTAAPWTPDWTLVIAIWLWLQYILDINGSVLWCHDGGRGDFLWEHFVWFSLWLHTRYSVYEWEITAFRVH